MSNNPETSNEPIEGVIVYGDEPAPHDPQAARDADNLAANLDEAALLGMKSDLYNLIADNFHAEGNKLICNRCDQVVTWVTKHCKERHGDDVAVFPIPAHWEEGQLW